MKDNWRKLAERYAALSRREQLMVAVAALAAAIFLLNAVWVSPAARRATFLRTQMAGDEAALTAMEAQVATLKTQIGDPDAASRKMLAELQMRLSLLDSQIGRLDDKLVPPQKMGRVLQTVLARHRGLSLVSLRSLPPEAILPSPDAKKGEQKAEKAMPEKSAVAERRENIYKHGLEIRVAGGYADLSGYVAELERAQQRLIFGDMALKVVAWPKSELTLTVYTLSRERDWLAL